MSAQTNSGDSSLNNQPERDASKLTSAGLSNPNQPPVPTDDQPKGKAPVDKKGDTWGGGIPGHNSEFKYMTNLYFLFILLFLFAFLHAK